MNYVFFGTPRFAEIILKGLLDAGIPPRAIVANPDRPTGRKKIVTSPPTKELILRATHGTNVAVFQPESFDEAFMRSLKGTQPDLFVVAAYAKIIPKSVLDIPRLGTIGVHPSLLPRYRGSSPIQSAILEGDRTTGVTLYHMDEKMDHGPIIASRTITMDPLSITYSALEEQLAKKSGTLLADLLQNVEAHIKHAEKQDERAATYTKKFTTEDAFIDHASLAKAEHGDQKLAETIVRKIHALSSEPGAWTLQEGKRVKLLDATIAHGALKLSKVQREGERPRSR